MGEDLADTTVTVEDLGDLEPEQEELKRKLLHDSPLRYKAAAEVLATDIGFLDTLVKTLMAREQNTVADYRIVLQAVNARRRILESLGLLEKDETKDETDDLL